MRLKCLTLLAVALALGACATMPQDTAQTRTLNPYPLVDVPMTPVSVACSTHQSGYIHSFYVQEPFSQHMAGGTNCGGTIAAGYMLPLQWRPGMKVKVRWKPNARDWIEKTTTIRRYDEAGDLTVHFFTNDEVRVVSSARYAPESP